MRFRRLLLALVASSIACAVGCRRSSEARIVRDAPERAVVAPKVDARAPCRIAGSMTLGYGVDLASARDGDLAFARFLNRPLQLETIDVPTFDSPRIGVRVEAKFGFALQGWVQHAKLDFEAGKTIELAGKTAYVPRGARLKMIVGAGKSIVVSPITRDLPPIDLLADCEAVAIGEVPKETSSPALSENAEKSSAETIYVLRGDTLPVAATPNGAPVFTLRASRGFQVPIVTTAEGLHLHLEDGIVVDGWVRASDVEVPTSLRLHGFGCGMGISMGTSHAAMGSLGVARREAAIFVGETPSGSARGAVTVGASVVVLRVAGAFAEIEPRCGEITAAPKERFFVEASALEIGERAPMATLRAVCR